jgi:hypothetical protein
MLFFHVTKHEHECGCCNFGFGLATKANVYKGVGQE